MKRSGLLLLLFLVSLGAAPPARATTVVPSIVTFGSPTDDPGCTLRWWRYEPPAPWAPPFPGALLLHGGGYIENNPTSSPGQRQAAQDLANLGFLVVSSEYRQVFNAHKEVDWPPGQTTQGDFNTSGVGLHSDQTIDAKMAARALQTDAECNGHYVALGGSGGGTHAVTLCLDHETATAAAGRAAWNPAWRADACVSMSGGFDFGNRIDPVYESLAFSTSRFQWYCDGAVGTDNTSFMTSVSPVTTMDADVKPIYLASARNDDMPYTQYQAMEARLIALGVTSYRALTVAGAGHTWGLWASIKDGPGGAIVFLQDSLAGTTPPPPSSVANILVKPR